ncbi:retrotransposon protein, putative, ty1-copia subclass [Tanacetum coccineum]
MNYIEHPIPAAPVPAQAGQQVAPEALAGHAAWVKGSKEIAGLMLMTMESDIQQNLENLGAYEMLQELKTLFAQQAEQELLQTMREFHSCKQEEGQSVSSYVLKMKSHIDNLERLGHPMSLGLGVSLILISLRKEFDGFVKNYNMQSMRKIINELHAMLKLHEQSRKYAGINQGKGKNKLAYAPKPKISPPPKRENPANDSICYECDHGSMTTVVVLYCNTTQGLRASRKLKPGTLSLYVGNGQHEAVEAISVFHLCLPSGLEIVLNNCHYAPFITRGVISVSRLYKDSFVNCFVNNTIQVSRNNMVYFSAIPKDGIFKIDLSNSYANDGSIYTVSNKRAKLDLDSALLWHYHLGHISKKRIEKLQHDGLLNSTDFRAFEKCVSCMSGKMARKPYTHQVERAKDLLGLIHTDVCGLIKIMSTQGASYFVTFTDDFSRYGYVYLLKHKHEVLKFQRSEFLDHLRDHGIIAHHTPPYTPQHNVWGCEALVKRDTLTKPDKLEPRSIKCIFIGYPKETMGYSFYYPPENKVLVSRNVEFLENSFITQKASESLEDLDIIQEEDIHSSIDTSLHHEEDDLEIDEPQSDIIPIRRSSKGHEMPHIVCAYNIDADDHELGDLGKPANYKAALLDPESDKWLSAMNVEMQSMKDNKV